MIIAVVGANGFVGSNLCKRYLKNGDTVNAIFNNKKELIPKGCSLHTVENLPESDIDFLFIAFGGHGCTHQQYLEQYLLINQIIKKLNFSKIIFISSIEVYGKHNDIISIDSSFKQPSMYGISKMTQEFLISSCDNYSIIRPTYIYGLGMKENSLIPFWKKTAKDNNEIIVYGSGNRRQDYIHIDDLIELCVLTTKSKNNTIIAASGFSISNIDLAKIISKYFYDIKISLKGEDLSSSYSFDITHTKETTSWYTKIPFEEGLKEYLSK
ncbi:NAD(P)-dependent oxidoreductase [Flavobacteriaceae bacterium]|nr:NAD(P)-dependent oxidoreductase [Flavobacteriaceae bacterium]